MDSYDPDLILDLAAGLLPEAAARAAEASLTPEGRAELAAQRAVLAAIAATPPAAMTDIERARLHRSVATRISEITRELSPIEVAAPPPRARGRRPRSVTWMRWASVAAVAATFVGVVAVGSQLGGLGFGGNDESADTAAAFAEATSTTAAAAATTRDGLGSSATTTLLAGGDGGSQAESATDQARLQLPEAPALSQTESKSDLGAVATFLQDLQRATPVDPTLPCYAVAAENLEIVDVFTLSYPGPDGVELTGIGYADAGTDTAERLIRIFDATTCEQVLANTD